MVSAMMMIYTLSGFCEDRDLGDYYDDGDVDGDEDDGDDDDDDDGEDDDDSDDMGVMVMMLMIVVMAKVENWRLAGDLICFQFVICGCVPFPISNNKFQLQN